MSASLPGSWLPNWLHGKPSTASPCLAYFSCSAARSSYCGVKPHSLAVFTIRTTFPLYWERSTSFPASVFILKFRACGTLAFSSPPTVLTHAATTPASNMLVHLDIEKLLGKKVGKRPLGRRFRWAKSTLPSYQPV